MSIYNQVNKPVLRRPVEPGQYNSVAYTLNGHTWSPVALLGPSIQLVSVSCTSGTFCIATGSGQAYEFNGSGWSNVSADGVDFGAVSCSSPTACIVAGDGTGTLGGGVFNRLDGGIWAGPAVLGAQEDPKSLSCISKDWCVGVGDQTQQSGSAIGDAYLYTRRAWDTPRTFSGSQVLVSVSCASESFCAAIGEDRSNNVNLFFVYHAK